MRSNMPLTRKMGMRPAHLEEAKKERTYYNACLKIAEEHYLKLGLKKSQLDQ